ncbi:hypothetical protein BKA70DRAFT_1213944 [Coprinopsis sp. MPI-PUGE-AT-0042]|nr:hypothetical protein BKA70DRAFT_1213944 [Coprinopsis sp. MPI-PUGE-AT-0042]
MASMPKPTGKNFGSRGTTMAVACVVAMSATLGSMYYMGSDIKQKEGHASPYHNNGQGHAGTDKAMSSSDVSAAVSLPKPRAKDRLTNAIPTSQSPPSSPPNPSAM